MTAGPDAVADSASSGSESVLTVVVFVGELRTRAQTVLDAVTRQTLPVAGIVFDLTPEHAPLIVPAGWARIATSMKAPLGSLRAEGARTAQTPYVAFLEDHAYPDPGWARALVEGLSKGYVAVGYSFENSNVTSLASRLAFSIDYGPWRRPVVSGPRQHLPGNYAAYKRSELLSLGEELDRLLAPDFNLQERLRRLGRAMACEDRASVRHDNFLRLTDGFRAAFNYARVLASRRAGLDHWSVGRRLAYAMAVLVVSPAIRLKRHFGAGSAGARPPAEDWLCLPVIVAGFLSGALGEATGALAGEGDAEDTFKALDFAARRG